VDRTLTQPDTTCQKLTLQDKTRAGLPRKQGSIGSFVVLPRVFRVRKVQKGHCVITGQGCIAPAEFVSASSVGVASRGRMETELFATWKVKA
jgi:hypothetical protein